MIQRIQTIWFLLAGITITCLIFIPTVKTISNGTEYFVIAQGLYQKLGTGTSLVKSSLPLLLMTIAVAIICVANIFNFKNRTRQKRLAIINIVFIIILSFWYSNFSRAIPGGLESANYGVGLFLPVLGILFCVLGIRGIKNDENLLKSADRLR